MTRLELARRLFGYDPDRTPQRTLDEARRSVIEAEVWHEADRNALADLSDDQIYEWWFDGNHQQHRATKRKIAKRTPKQIRLAARHRGDRQIYLPRQRLEAGEFVSHGKGWWLPDYVFGWVIRPKLEEQLADSARRLQECKARVLEAECAYMNDDLVLDRDQRHLMEVVIDTMPKSKIPSHTPNVDWRKEGF